MLVFLMQAVNSVGGWASVNWNIILPTIISAVSGAFVLYITLQNNRLATTAREIHEAVNHTAADLARKATAQENLVNRLVEQVALLTEQARGKTMAGLVEKAHAAEEEKKP